MRLLFLFIFVLTADYSFAQTKTDPVQLRDDGLPAASPRDADPPEAERDRENYQPNRQHIPGTINRTEPEQQPLEYRSEFEPDENKKHFENDTTRVPVRTTPISQPPAAPADTSRGGALRTPQ